MTGFKIRSSGKECIECRKRFQVEEGFYSLLQIEDEAAVRREDRCAACWASSTPPKESVWWRTRRRPEAAGKTRIDFESVLALFLQVAEDPRPEVEGLKYVAALLLVRRRMLRLIETVHGQEGESMRLQRPRGESRIFQIPVPSLAPEDLERLKANLKEALTLES